MLSSCPGERGWFGPQGQDLPVKGVYRSAELFQLAWSAKKWERKEGYVRAQFRASSNHAMHQEVHDGVRRWHRIERGVSVPTSELKYSSRYGREAASNRTSYSLHAEMQLFMRYEENAALTPTLYYFGRSKKACLLCDGFLQSLPSPIATRGRALGVTILWSDWINVCRRSLLRRIQGARCLAMIEL